MLMITAVAAAILGFLYFKLSINVIKFRQKYGVSIGDGGQENLLRAIRAQANLAEYAPIGLILIACLEVNQAPFWLTLILAIMFVMGRVLHPMGMQDATLSFNPRVNGMKLTLIAIGLLSVSNLVVVGLHLF